MKKWIVMAIVIVMGVVACSVPALDIGDGTGASTNTNSVGDTSAPVLSDISPTNSQEVVVFGGSFSLQGSVTDVSTSVVWVKFDSASFGSVPVSGGSWTTNFSGVTNGSNTIYVYAVDSVGNTSSTNEIAILVVDSKKIVVDDGASGDWLGMYLAMSDDGSTLLAGTLRESVYRFKTSDGGVTWSTNKITAYDVMMDDKFGSSIAMSADGNTLLIGAYADDDNGENSGSVYLLQTIDAGATWSTNKITAYDGTSANNFGSSVAMSADGNTLLVGADYDDDMGLNSGSVYRFKTTNGGATWSTNKIVAFDGEVNGYFGNSVAMSSDGNTLLVGAYGHDGYHGAVYRFQTSDGGTNWTTNLILVEDDGLMRKLGYSVDISSDGNTILAGAYCDEDNGSESGAVYRFKTIDNGATWTTNKILAYDGAVEDEFGESVAMSSDGNTLLVGAYKDDDNGSISGSVYRFKTIDNGVTWTTNKYNAYDGVEYDVFGKFVAISGDGNKLFISAPGDNDMGLNSGSLYWYKE